MSTEFDPTKPVEVVETKEPNKAPDWSEGLETLENGHIGTVEAEAEAETEEPKAEKPKRKTRTVKKKASKPKTSSVALDDFGFRKGTARSKAASMYASAKGATLAEVKAKTGTIQYNMLTKLKSLGFKVTSKDTPGKGNRPATRYFLSEKKRSG